MIKHVSCYFYTLCFVICFCHAIRKREATSETEFLKKLEDDHNTRLDFITFCSSANLIVMTYPNLEMNTIQIIFKISNPEFKDCFTFYDIFLERRRRIVNVAKIPYVYDEIKAASYTFKNVTCGQYEVVVQPCYNDWQCAPFRVRYPKILNMSSNDCKMSPENPGKKFMPLENPEKQVEILKIVLGAITVLCVAGLAFYYFACRKLKTKPADVCLETGDISQNVCKKGSNMKKVHVYIFHRYDENNVIKNRVDVLQNFLEESLLYKSVNVIDGELAQIMDDANGWLLKALEKVSEDGGLVKLIIIDSSDENEAEDYFIENSIYTQAIQTLDTDKCRILRDYDSLFVARVSDMGVRSKKIAHFVSGHRYEITNKYHLINLCINLSSDSGLDDNEVEKHLFDLYSRHDIRFMGLT